MPIEIQDLNGAVTRVVLSGRMDVAGAHDLDLPLAVVGGSRRAVVFDLAAVEFLASLGLRGLVMSAKAIFSKGGKAVLLSPQPQVREVITVTGIDDLIPVFDDEAAAFAAVQPA